MTTDVTIPRPLLELNLADVESNQVRLDLWRIPGTVLTDSTSGYYLYRAKSRAGFAGSLGDDDTGHEKLSTTVAQPASTTVRIAQALTSQPASVDLFYAVRAVDSLTTPTRYSELSNVVKVQALTDRQVAVPACPTTLEPNRGIMNGLVTNLQDSAVADGMTWYEFARIRIEVGEAIWEAMMDTFHSDDVASTMFRRPPASLIRWYSAQVALEVLPSSGIPATRQQELVDRYSAEVDRWREAFYSGSTIHVPSASSRVQLGIGRVVR